jgi:hypothetical protein
MKANQVTLLSPKEILLAYPQARQYFDERKLGFLLYLGLVRGKKLIRSCELCLEDVKRVVEFKTEHA